MIVFLWNEALSQYTGGGMATGSSLLPALGYEDTQECTGYFKLWAHTVMVLERSKGRAATVQRQLQ